MRINNPFTEHPGAIGETYWQHMGTAARFAGFFFFGAFVSLVHAVLPFLFTHTGSNLIARLHQRMSHRAFSQGAARPSSAKRT